MRAFVKYIPFLSLIIIIVTLPEVGMCQTDVDVETAVLPLPANLQSNASVMTYTAEGTLRIIRSGTNGFFCIADNPRDQQFSVACHPESMRPYLERRRQLSLTESRTVRDSLLTEEIKEGKIELAVGTLSRFISGSINPETRVPDSVRVWSEIAVPFAGPEKTGLTTEDAGEAPWMMRPNQYGAHIMMDYSTVAWTDLRKSNE